MQKPLPLGTLRAMGIFRKATSISSMGLVPYRSKKEKLARAPLKTNKYLRRQNAIGVASLYVQAQQLKRTPEQSPSQPVEPAPGIPLGPVPYKQTWGKPPPPPWQQ